MSQTRRREVSPDPESDRIQKAFEAASKAESLLKKALQDKQGLHGIALENHIDDLRLGRYGQKDAADVRVMTIEMVKTLNNIALSANETVLRDRGHTGRSFAAMMWGLPGNDNKATGRPVFRNNLRHLGIGQRILKRGSNVLARRAVPDIDCDILFVNLLNKSSTPVNIVDFENTTIGNLFNNFVCQTSASHFRFTLGSLNLPVHIPLKELHVRPGTVICWGPDPRFD